MKEFIAHCKNCRECATFPISMACYTGAKILNPDLPDIDEDEYIKRMEALHEDCEWCDS